MWDEAYLETCCRSALHRLVLSGSAGRPAGLKDGPCLLRLMERGLASSRPDGRLEVTPLGRERHASEIGSAFPSSFHLCELRQSVDAHLDAEHA